ncbi:MAG: lyase family protein, partial [Pseudomonadota bacterium]
VVTILQTRLSALLVQFETLIRAQGALPAMARTRYQDALPFTIGDRVRTWVAPLQGLADTAPDHFPLQLGGPIGLREAAYGRNNKAIAEAMAADLQLSFASEAWHTDRRAIGAVASWCLDLATVLGKVGQDVAIMAQTPVGEIRAPGGGSSAMPHKSNPVGAERLVTLARYVAGNAAMLQTAALHENERSGIAWSLEWLALPPVLIGCGSALLTAQELIEGLEPGHRGPG